MYQKKLVRISSEIRICNKAGDDECARSEKRKNLVNYTVVDLVYAMQIKFEHFVKVNFFKNCFSSNSSSNGLANFNLQFLQCNQF